VKGVQVGFCASALEKELLLLYRVWLRAIIPLLRINAFYLYLLISSSFKKIFLIINNILLNKIYHFDYLIL